jgi:uncharacterized coiled-coil protein SlyX
LAIAKTITKQNRYMKCLADRFQLKIREEKTKRKKPPHF